MADDVKDVAIYTGSEWTSLSELAAGVVDAKLPIESDDGTVVLDSPSANTFTVSNGGAERVKVDAYGVSIVSGNQLNITRVTSGNSIGVFDIDPSNTVANSGFGIKVDGKYSLYRSALGNFGFGDDYTNPSTKVAVDGDIQAASFVQKGATGTGISFPTVESMRLESKGVSIVDFDLLQAAFHKNIIVDADKQIQTDTITTAAGAVGDASIELGAELLTSNHTPTQPNSIATKKTVDDKIWVGTTASYNNVNPKLPGTLYCLTD